MNTQLATIPEKSSVKPKPTKTEIITALATLHIQKLEKENTELTDRRDKLEKKIHDLMIATVKKDGFKTLPSTANTGHRYNSNISRVQLEIDFPMSPDSALTKLLNEYHDCKRVVVPSLREACSFIRARMENRAAGEIRIKQLLADTETRKALDSALDQIGFAA